MKKEYLSPRMKVVKVQQTQIICGSLTEAKTSQNEKYEEEDPEETGHYWFGLYH